MRHWISSPNPKSTSACNPQGWEGLALLERKKKKNYQFSAWAARVRMPGERRLTCPEGFYQQILLHRI